MLNFFIEHYSLSSSLFECKYIQILQQLNLVMRAANQYTIYPQIQNLSLKINNLNWKVEFIMMANLKLIVEVAIINLKRITE